MCEQPVQAAIEGVLGNLAQRDAEHIAQATVGQPVPVEPPFTARIEQAVSGEDLEKSFPIGAFAAGGQAGRPEGVQFELLPELARDPAGAPRARAVQRELAQADLDGVGHVGGEGVGGGEEGQWGGGLTVGVEDGDGLGPGGFLAVIDLAQIQELALGTGAAGGADFFGEGPVAVVLAVLETAVAVQKRLAHNFDGAGYRKRGRGGRGWVGAQTLLAGAIVENMGLFGGGAPENSWNRPPVAKVRLTGKPEI